MIISVIKEPGLFEILSQSNISYHIIFHRSAVVVSESDLVQGCDNVWPAEQGMLSGGSRGRGVGGEEASGDDDRENGQQENSIDGEGGGRGLYLSRKPNF